MKSLMIAVVVLQMGMNRDRATEKQQGTGPE